MNTSQLLAIKAANTPEDEEIFPGVIFHLISINSHIVDSDTITKYYVTGRRSARAGSKPAIPSLTQKKSSAKMCMLYLQEIPIFFLNNRPAHAGSFRTSS